MTPTQSSIAVCKRTLVISSILCTSALLLLVKYSFHISTTSFCFQWHMYYKLQKNKIIQHNGLSFFTYSVYLFRYILCCLLSFSSSNSYLHISVQSFPSCLKPMEVGRRLKLPSHPITPVCIQFPSSSETDFFSVWLTN